MGHAVAIILQGPSASDFRTAAIPGMQKLQTGAEQAMLKPIQDGQRGYVG